MQEGTALSSTIEESQESRAANTGETTDITIPEEHSLENGNTAAESTAKLADKAEPSSEPVTKQPEEPKEEEPVKRAQFYIIVGETTFTADFADNSSADALRELLAQGDLTINMSDYSSFEKVGSIGQSLPREDTQISTVTGDVILYQGNQIVIFYGTNSWSYSRLGKIQNATKDDLLAAFGSGNVTITFSLAK
ncbi:MAG: hypothetical protein HFI34_05675 [Lachnospiraceae bacterium]|nr:hypothetical protein [Lachnospiraceae bacterium]